MRKLNIANKLILSFLLCATILIGTFSCTVQAGVPYSSPWGKLYREPETSNQYGRAWYQVYRNHGKIYYADIFLESFYSDGSSTSITQKYYKNNKVYNRKVEECNKVRGYSSSESDIESTYVSVRIYGAGHGISVDKIYKK